MQLTILSCITLLPAISLAFEPFSAIYIAGTAAASVGGYLYYNYYGCGKVECCQPPWVHESPVLDFSDLYGQPLVVQVISDILKRRYGLPKPLALSFHGPTGTGKTFFSSMFSKMLFRKSLDSEYVRFFTVGTDFPDPSKALEYSSKLTETILRQLSKCDKSTFFFEEFEKLPNGVVAAITPFLERRGSVNGVNTKNATFIFISNTGSKAIVAKAFELWRSSKDRNRFELRDFEEVIRLAVYNEEGAYQSSNIVKSDLIDAFVPFLPLEKEHIKSCINTDFWTINKRKPTPAEIDKVLADIRFTSDLNDLYAETGCKKVASLIWRFTD